MLFVFRVSNNKLTENALVVPITAESADEAWGRFNVQEEKKKWKNVKLEYIGGEDRVLPGRKRTMAHTNRARADRAAPGYLGDG
jgi:hypothetical protein